MLRSALGYICHRVLRLTLRRKKLDRARFLLPDEWARVKAVIDREVDKVRVYFYVLMLEGSRMSELRYMAWDHVDLKAGFWHKPLTKNGLPQTLALSPAACKLLDALPRKGVYVFPGEHPNIPWSRTAVQYHWDKIRFLAGVKNIQIRDLRRTCASWLAMNGENTKVIQDVLGHTGPEITQRVYMKLDQRSVREALTRHSHQVMGV